MVGGGAERVVSILSGDFVSRGYEVEIVVYRHVEHTYPLAEGVRLSTLDGIPDAGKVSLLTRLKAIRDKVQKCNPDYVISFLTSVNMNVCIASIGLPCKVIVSERNDPNQIGGILNRLRRNLAYSFADKFVFQTHQAMKCFSKKIQKRSQVILNPILGTFPTREKIDKRIVAVGRLNYQKNYPLLLHSFVPIAKKYPDYILEIYGEGELYNTLHKLCIDLGIQQNVVFKGFQRNVHECIKNSSMYVMSSDFEGLPNALLEAMCIGIPCISTDCPCGGPRMLMEGKDNGILVPVEDVVALAEAMKQLLRDGKMWRKCSRNAYESMKELHPDNINKKWEDYLLSKMK
jgi:glycosyltransferase involved in cell wall biosynthesis